MLTTGANSSRRVAIIGGGIAGLAAALSFARTGADVRVYEQAPEITEVGAGIQITPNGASFLAALGLDGAARSIDVQELWPTDGLSGRVLGRFNLQSGQGHPYRFYHRADLLDLLYQGCLAAGVSIHTAHRAINVSSNSITFKNGVTVQADLIVGADGLHSIVRPMLNGADAPFFTGQVAWRAIVRAEDAAPVARIWMAPNKHVVTYPLQGGRLNVVAVREQSEWAAEGWHHADRPHSLRSAFEDCAPELRSILARADKVRLWGLFRHPVAKVWHRDGLVILGDAAHPTLPFLAQGANLALEDAYVLAQCTNDAADLETGLSAFQTGRIARVTRAIEAANANAVNYHLDGFKRMAGHAAIQAIARTAPQLFLRRFDWLYRYDVGV